eukprot:3939016-Rhodomonas_salina.4
MLDCCREDRLLSCFETEFVFEFLCEMLYANARMGSAYRRRWLMSEGCVGLHSSLHCASHRCTGTGVEHRLIAARCNVNARST